MLLKLTVQVPTWRLGNSGTSELEQTSRHEQRAKEFQYDTVTLAYTSENYKASARPDKSMLSP